MAPREDQATLTRSSTRSANKERARRDSLTWPHAVSTQSRPGSSGHRLVRPQQDQPFTLLRSVQTDAALGDALVRESHAVQSNSPVPAVDEVPRALRALAADAVIA